ncbi:MAG: tRNA dihydrouridine synthase DusB [Eubacteriaceae bacterium]|nr:tRNA dihydrouridine synthase DusB [Eubacteriaceae bacterium]
MIIGNTKIKGNLVLAPMAGITNLPFRLLCLRQGCSLVFTEMISAKALHYKDANTRELLLTSAEDKPCGVQIFGSDPDLMSKVIKEDINRTSFEIVDINAGCPAPKIVKNSDGSALMKNPELIGEIIYKAVRVSEKPVTLKIRAGWDEKNVNAMEVAKIAEIAGAAAVTVHGRTKEQYYSGKANWDVIKDVKTAVNIPVIGNGDVANRDEALKMLEYTGCDGVMIGRAALGNPWIFNETRKDEVGTEEKLDMCINYFHMLLDIKPERVALGEIRKHIGWFAKGLRGSGSFRDEINRSTSTEEVFCMLKKYKTEI